MIFQNFIWKSIVFIFSFKGHIFSYCTGAFVFFYFLEWKVLLAVLCFRIELEWGFTAFFFPKTRMLFFFFFFLHISNRYQYFNLAGFSVQGSTGVAPPNLTLWAAYAKNKTKQHPNNNKIEGNSNNKTPKFSNPSGLISVKLTLLTLQRHWTSHVGQCFRCLNNSLSFTSNFRLQL